jgi:glucose-6-phosphate isomerase
MLIALYERAVGIYASLIGINAYHQPGVEAGKKAAGRVLDLQQQALAVLRESPGTAWTAEDLAAHLGAREEVETLHHILEHAAANPDHGIGVTPGRTPGTATYTATG